MKAIVVGYNDTDMGKMLFYANENTYASDAQSAKRFKTRNEAKQIAAEETRQFRRKGRKVKIEPFQFIVRRMKP